ncbi:hypothetical protein [Leisingera sp. NJS201]|uniref:hypothetical protein n=1 Tax=Leisingera sp. NJS201 TaxID=2508306 RepID=UPI0020C80197|nr:hypothetical protein [Leisingera sp. NJS201]
MPWQRDADTIRLFGGMRDDQGISRIGWVDVDASDPLQVKAVSEQPAIGLGAPGMFDDNGMILGDVLEVAENELRLYYVGFQLVEKAKFLAFSGLAISRDRGDSFERVQQTPVIDRCPKVPSSVRFILSPRFPMAPTGLGYPAALAGRTSAAGCFRNMTAGR